MFNKISCTFLAALLASGSMHGMQEADGSCDMDTRGDAPSMASVVDAFSLFQNFQKNGHKGMAPDDAVRLACSSAVFAMKSAHELADQAKTTEEINACQFFLRSIDSHASQTSESYIKGSNSNSMAWRETFASDAEQGFLRERKKLGGCYRGLEARAAELKKLEELKDSRKRSLHSSQSDAKRAKK